MLSSVRWQWCGTTQLTSLAATTQKVFEGVHREMFVGDPAANPRLKVEVVDPQEVGQVPTLILITPWTLNGLVFAGDRQFPHSLQVGSRVLPVFDHELEDIGRYRSVNLVSDVSTLDSPDTARQIAHTLGADFRKAVGRVFDLAGVDDVSRRHLLRVPLGADAPLSTSHGDLPIPAEGWPPPASCSRLVREHPNPVQLPAGPVTGPTAWRTG